LSSEDGAVPFLPAVHVDQLVQPTLAALFWAWYFPLMHSVQAVDLVPNANPAAQLEQVVPLNVLEVWYIPVAHALQLVDAVPK
jgi:hypothetical protein